MTGIYVNGWMREEKVDVGILTSTIFNDDDWSGENLS